MKSPVSRTLNGILADSGLVLAMLLLTSGYDGTSYVSRHTSKLIIFLVLAVLITVLRAVLRRLVHGRGGAEWNQQTWNRVVNAAERLAEQHSADPAIEERKKAALRAIDRDMTTRDLIESGELLPYDALRPYFEQKPQPATPRRTGPPMRVPNRPVPPRPPAAPAPESEAD